MLPRGHSYLWLIYKPKTIYFFTKIKFKKKIKKGQYRVPVQILPPNKIFIFKMFLMYWVSFDRAFSGDLEYINRSKNKNITFWKIGFKVAKKRFKIRIFSTLNYFFIFNLIAIFTIFVSFYRDFACVYENYLTFKSWLFLKEKNSLKSGIRT